MQFIFVYVDQDACEADVHIMNGETLELALNNFAQHEDFFDWLWEADPVYSKTEEPERFLNEIKEFINEQNMFRYNIKFYKIEDMNSLTEVKLSED